MMEKRKRLLIIPSFQISFLVYTAISTVVLTSVFLISNRYFFWKFNEKAREMNVPAEHIYFKFLAEQESTMNMIFIVSAMTILLINFIYGLYMSHRIAGPVYRIQQFVESVLNGKSIPLSFRKSDYFHELATAVNKLVKGASGKTK